MRSPLLIALSFSMVCACDDDSLVDDTLARVRAEVAARREAAHEALAGCSVAFAAQRVEPGVGLECIHIDFITFGELEALLGPAPARVTPGSSCTPSSGCRSRPTTS